MVNQHPGAQFHQSCGEKEGTSLGFDHSFHPSRVGLTRLESSGLVVLYLDPDRQTLNRTRCCRIFGDLERGNRRRVVFHFHGLRQHAICMWRFSSGDHE